MRRLCLSVVVTAGCQGSSDASSTNAWDPEGTTTTTTTTSGDSTGEAETGEGEGGSTGTSSSGAITSETGNTMTSGTDDSTTGGPEPTAAEHYMGRFEFSEGAPRSTWSGSTARTRIAGTEVAIGLDGPSGIHFQTVIDGTPSDVFVTSSGAQSYPVASGLAPGEHDIEVVRRNEGYFGIVSYLGFEPGPDTTLVETPWPYGMHVEFIGDSLTAGYGIECDSGEENFSAPTQSAYASYAMVAGRELGASVHLVAYSGKGVFQNYGGDMTEPMPVLWPRTFTTQPEPQWDWSARPADVVVVNLGTNDFSAAIDQADFVDAYVELLQDVRGRYPAATILGITWAHWGATHEGWVQDALQASGDPNAASERFVIDADEGWGCDFHTNEVTNARLGQQLADRIAEL